MFPISEQAKIIIGAAAVFVACVAIFLPARGRYRLLATAPFLGLGLFALVQFNVGEGQYEALGDFLIVAALLAVLLGALLWSVVVRAVSARLAKGGKRSQPTRAGLLPVTILLAVAPAIVSTAIALERQYLSDATCVSDGITARVGDMNYNVPILLQPRLEYGTGWMTERKIRFYTRQSDDKEDVHSICSETRNGQIPLETKVIWFNPVILGKNLYPLCSADADLPDMCRNFHPASFAITGKVRLTPSGMALSGGTKSWFARKDDPKVLTGGTLDDGFVCIGGVEPGQSTECTVWKPAGGGNTIVASTRSLNRSSREVSLEALNTTLGDAMKIMTK